MECAHCGKNLTPEEMRGEACRYCGTVLPHRARAMEKAAVVREVLADADGDGIPDVVQHLMGGGLPGAGKGHVQVSVTTTSGGGVPAELAEMLAARGASVSSSVVVTSTSTTTTSVTGDGALPPEAKAMLEQMGLGGIVGGAQATSGSVGVGARVLVQWSDGNRYPGEVVAVAAGKVQVRFSDGRVLWIGEGFLSRA